MNRISKPRLFYKRTNLISKSKSKSKSAPISTYNSKSYASRLVPVVMLMMCCSVAQLLNSSRRGCLLVTASPWGCQAAYCSQSQRRFHSQRQRQGQGVYVSTLNIGRSHGFGRRLTVGMFHRNHNIDRAFTSQFNNERGEGTRIQASLSGNNDDNGDTNMNIDVGHNNINIKDKHYNTDENNWRSHPLLPETYLIPTVLVAEGSVHTIIKELAPFLATRKKEFENVHPRLKAVQDLDHIGNGDYLEYADYEINSMSNMKAILLDSSTTSGADDDKNTNNESIIIKNGIIDGSKEERVKALTHAFPKLSKDTINLLMNASAIPGPIISKTIPYTQQPLQRILSKILPPEALPPPTGFEQIGHVIHLNLKERHHPHRHMIGSVILDQLSPKIQTVVNKVGEVGGLYRTYDMEVIAGKSQTTVEVIEDGVSLHFDLRKVYWCTRLSGERSRMIKHEFKEGQIIADAFCGVGALCVLAASKLGCTIYANDLNPDAVKYMKESAKKNHRRIKANHENSDVSSSSSQFTSSGSGMPSINVHCGDAFDFIQNLGSLPELPDHVVMNYPLDSSSFLGAFRWWPASNEKTKSSPTIVHLYTFARGDDPNNSEYDYEHTNPRSAIDVAIDLVAGGLLPEGGAIETSRYRRAYLDKLGCDVRAIEVRDVAPGKVVICVSFKISNLLLSVMQGDFIDFD